MKKILNYLAGVAMMAFCVFGISACGSDDNTTPNRPLQMNGEWLALIQQPGILLYEIDEFSGSTIKATIYKIEGYNVISGTSLVEANVKKIEKSTGSGTFTYKNGVLTVTYGEKVNEGLVRYGEDQNVIYWTVNNNDFEMLRPNTATQTFTKQVENLYEKLNKK